MNGYVQEIWPPAYRPAVDDALWLAEQRGQLVAVTDLPAPPQMRAVVVTLRPGRLTPTPKPVRVRWWTRWAVWRRVLRLLVAVVATVAGVAAGLWLRAHWREVFATALGVLAVALLLRALVGAVSGGGSGHCSGPNTGH
jgi:hypothetical protein